MTIADTVDYRGYTIAIHYDNDAGNPLTEFFAQPTLILHDKAEGHFGWTTDMQWAARLDDCLDRAHGGKDHALRLFTRWARTYHGVTVMLPVGAIQHGGTEVYLGSGAAFGDPGGWDSGWIGFMFATPKQAQEWYGGDPSVEQLAEAITGSFGEFASWVSGAVFGYVITGPDGEEIDDGSCWGFYGYDCYQKPDGYMRQQFQDVIDYEIAERDTAATQAKALTDADQAEIDEMRLAETGVKT